MNPLTLLKGDTLGKTIYNVLAAIALASIVGWFGWGVVTGKYWKWQAQRQEDRADRAEQQAATAQGNANSANYGALNASQTRANMSTAAIDIRLLTEQAAGRAETYDPNDFDSNGAMPTNVVRELDAAEDRAGTAADRLRGKRAGRTNPKAP